MNGILNLLSNEENFKELLDETFEAIDDKKQYAVNDQEKDFLNKTVDTLNYVKDKSYNREVMAKTLEELLVEDNFLKSVVVNNVSDTIKIKICLCYALNIVIFESMLN